MDPQLTNPSRSNCFLFRHLMRSYRKGKKEIIKKKKKSLQVFGDEPSWTTQSYLSSGFLLILCQSLQMLCLDIVFLVSFKFFTTLELSDDALHIWVWRKCSLTLQAIDLGRLSLWTHTMFCSMHIWVRDFWGVGGILGFSWSSLLSTSESSRGQSSFTD